MNRERPKRGGGGAIDCCEAADFCCGGDPSVIKERQIEGGISVSVNPWGGEWEQGNWGTGPRGEGIGEQGNWRRFVNGNSEIVEC